MSNLLRTLLMDAREENKKLREEITDLKHQVRVLSWSNAARSKMVKAPSAWTDDLEEQFVQRGERIAELEAMIDNFSAHASGHYSETSQLRKRVVELEAEIKEMRKRSQ